MVKLLSIVWFVAALGNSLDYWSTRKALSLQKKARPHISEFDGELNPLMKWLMVNGKTPIVPFLVIQVAIAVWFSLLSYDNALLVAGILLCAGYYTSVRCAEWFRWNAVVDVIEGEGVEPIIWRVL